jgi:hypothetical protein
MGRVRLGLVLEDIDSLAADIAARHLAGSEKVRGASGLVEGGLALPFKSLNLAVEPTPVEPTPYLGRHQGFGVITASMDKLQLVTHEEHAQQLRLAALSLGGGAGAPLDPGSGGPLLIDNDLRLAGCVSWVGRSSLEVTIELANRHGGGGDGGAWRRRGVAHFVMVVRSADPTRPVALQPLAPTTPAEQELCRQAAARHEARRARRQADAAAGQGHVAGPESALLQALVLQAQQHRAQQWQPRQQAEDGEVSLPAVPMGSTGLQSPVIMHHQDRNITDAIFGGHVS